MSKKLEGSIALVTGASRGIGAAIAKRYAKEGAHVILVARTVGGLEEVDDAIKAENGKSTLVPLDLQDFTKFGQLANIINEKFGKLDILVGNAATIGALAPITHMPVKKWDEVMNLNLNVNWHLLRTCEPLLKLSEAGRVIFVSSGVTKHVFPYWGPYAISKIGLEMMTKVYAAENEKTKIRANIVDPGVVKTRMRAEAMPGENPENLTPPEEITDVFVKLAEKSFNKTGQIFNAQ